MTAQERKNISDRLRPFFIVQQVVQANSELYIYNKALHYCLY